MTDINHHSIHTDDDNSQPSPPQQHPSHTTPATLTDGPTADNSQAQPQVQEHTTSTIQPSATVTDDNVVRPNTNARVIRVRVSYTVSTVTHPSAVSGSPRSIVSPIHLTTFENYPSEFEAFTKEDVVHCLTEYVESRYIRVNRELKAQNIPASTDKKAIFYSVSIPDMETHPYINRLVTYSKVSRLDLLMMLIFTDRIATTHIALVPSEQNVHRLLAAALALSSRLNGWLDAHHACKVAGIASIDELSKMIDAFLYFINYRTTVSRETLENTFNSLNTIRQTTTENHVEDNTTSTAMTIAQS